MKKTVALLAFAAALAAPLAAQAHRAWMAPTSTSLSGADAWVGFDAGMSNGVFIPDHAAMRMTGLVVTAPDGSTVQPEHLMQAQYRTTFDVHLTQNGTYKVANVMGGVMASYTLNGEQKRWRGTAAEYPAALPQGATDVQATRTVGQGGSRAKDGLTRTAGGRNGDKIAQSTLRLTRDNYSRPSRKRAGSNGQPRRSNPCL